MPRERPDNRVKASERAEHRDRIKAAQAFYQINEEYSSTASTGPQTKHCRVIMLEVMSSQFDSFLFWRQPIPSLDLSELEDLGLSELVPKSGQMGKGSKSSVKSPPVDEDDDLDLSEFSTFNYWKEPIASIDALDFNLLL
ncbi:hypothetical protein MHYP_G00346550 [Metynnis hypsauchen]